MSTRRRFLVAASAFGLPVVALKALDKPGLPRLRITVGPEPLYNAADMKVWLDGVDITRNIPIRNERRMRRAKPGDVLTFTLYRTKADGSWYIEGGKAGGPATDVVRALVIA